MINASDVCNSLVIQDYSIPEDGLVRKGHYTVVNDKKTQHRFVLGSPLASLVAGASYGPKLAQGFQVRVYQKTLEPHQTCSK